MVMKKKVPKKEFVKLSLFGGAKEASTREKRAVIQKDVGPKAKGPMPYFGAKQGKYAYARHETPVPPGGQAIPPQYGTPQYNAPVQTPAQPAPSSNMGVWITGIIIFFVIIYVLMTMSDGGGGGYCQTTCDGYAISVAPGCDCPAGSRYYNTITSGDCIGCKQCICG